MFRVLKVAWELSSANKNPIKIPLQAKIKLILECGNVMVRMKNMSMTVWTIMLTEKKVSTLLTFQARILNENTGRRNFCCKVKGKAIRNYW